MPGRQTPSELLRSYIFSKYTRSCKQVASEFNAVPWTKVIWIKDKMTKFEIPSSNGAWTWASANKPLQLAWSLANKPLQLAWSLASCLQFRCSGSFSTCVCHRCRGRLLLRCPTGSVSKTLRATLPCHLWLYFTSLYFTTNWELRPLSDMNKLKLKWTKATWLKFSFGSGIKTHHLKVK